MRIESSGQAPGLGPGHQVSLSDSLYQWLASAAHRTPSPRFVKIVVLSPSQEPAEIFDDTCKKREFVAALLNRISSASPSTTVLDFWYPGEFCNSGDGVRQNSQLQAAIQRAAGLFPVVIGSSTHTERELELENDPDLQRLKQSGLRERDQILDASYSFPGRNISYGLVRINADAQHISTLWSVYSDKSAVINHTPPEAIPSLAYAAATAYRHSIGRQFLDESGGRAITALAPESAFDPIHAIDLLCADYKQGDDWRHCEPPSRINDSRLNSLTGRVVLIAQQNLQSDLWNSSTGEVPGYLLQANYIESLLSKRYSKAVGSLWEMLFMLLGTIVILILLEDNRSDFVRLLRGVFTLAIIVIGGSVLLVYFGFFTIITLPLAIVVSLHFTVRLLRLVASSIEPKRRQTRKIGSTLTITKNAEV